MGVEGLALFKLTLGYIQGGHYQLAADEMLKSVWAIQTPERAKRNAAMISTGRYPDGGLI